jgi:hypothetical protein
MSVLPPYEETPFKHETIQAVLHGESVQMAEAVQEASAIEIERGIT